jgi:hypothetical protein
MPGKPGTPVLPLSPFGPHGPGGPPSPFDPFGPGKPSVPAKPCIPVNGEKEIVIVFKYFFMFLSTVIENHQQIDLEIDFKISDGEESFKVSAIYQETKESGEVDDVCELRFISVRLDTRRSTTNNKNRE